MPGYNNLEIFEGLKELREEIPHLLPKEQILPLEAYLIALEKQVHQNGLQDEYITAMLGLVGGNQTLRNELKAILIRSFGLRSEVRLGLLLVDNQVPGYGDVVKTDRKWCCPADPTHYVTRKYEKGKRCPQHNIELVPLDSLQAV